MSGRTFYGDKLRLARLLNGLTQKELGDAVTSSRQFIHQIEGDIRQPPEDMLYALCERLMVNQDFFFTPLQNDVKFEQCHFRKRKTTPVSLANRVCAYSTLFEELVGFIKKYLDLPENNFPDISNDTEHYSNLEIESAAESCRKHWNLGTDNPLTSITNVLENNGVVITSFSGVSEKVDALSINRKHPIIIRNDAKESPCRLRFDLAHECGHFVLHNGVETGDTVTESEADKFASAFIFPKKAFVKEFPKIFIVNREKSWEPLYKLKIRWGMSLKAILYRAHFLQLITAQQYRAANVRLSKTGQSKNEKYDSSIPIEQPQLLKSSINMLTEHFGLTFSKISDCLQIEKQMLSTITGMDIPTDTKQTNIEPIFRG